MTTPSLTTTQSKYRDVSVCRVLPVRDLTMDECRRLKVHAHVCSRDRSKAYLLKSTPNPEVYFSESERARIQEWIDSEKAKTATNASAINNLRNDADRLRLRNARLMAALLEMKRWFEAKPIRTSLGGGHPLGVIRNAIKADENA